MQCSASCGVGVQNREVYCRLKGSGRVRDDACDVGQRPAQARPCQRADCSPYTWEAGDWEEVSIPPRPFPLLAPVSLSTTQMSRCLGHLVRGVFIGPALRSALLFSAPLNRRPADTLALLRHPPGALLIAIEREIISRPRLLPAIISLLSC